MTTTHVMQVKRPAVLLLGEPGAGKTFSLAKLGRHYKVVVLFTEPGGEESLISGARHYDVPIKQFHWNYVSPSSSGWDALQSLAKQISMRDYESMTKIKMGINKGDHQQFWDLLGLLADFKCARTGRSLGPVDELDPEKYAICLDSLSGLNQMARDMVVGAKPGMHQGEWGIAMSAEENLIRKFAADIPCFSVMVGHMDKQMDEIAGRPMMQVSLLGQKLAPVIPRMFSDVILAYKEGREFYWATSYPNVSSLKSRNLPLGEKFPADFDSIIEAYEERKTYAGTLDEDNENVGEGEE